MVVKSPMEELASRVHHVWNTRVKLSINSAVGAGKYGQERTATGDVGCGKADRPPVQYGMFLVHGGENLDNNLLIFLCMRVHYKWTGIAGTNKSSALLSLTLKDAKLCSLAGDICSLLSAARFCGTHLHLHALQASLPYQLPLLQASGQVHKINSKMSCISEASASSFRRIVGIACCTLGSVRTDVSLYTVLTG